MDRRSEQVITRGLSLFFACILLCACSNNAKEFCEEQHIKWEEGIPLSFKNEKWNDIGFGYKYIFGTFELNGKKKALLLFGNTKKNQLSFFCDITRHLIVLDSLEGKDRKIYELYHTDIDREVDLSCLNETIRSMPEMQNFSWSNPKQNEMLVLMTRLFLFTAVTDKGTIKKTVGDSTGSSIESRTRRVSRILNGKHSYLRKGMYIFNAGRSIKTYDMLQNMGFRFDDPEAAAHYKKEGITLQNRLEDEGIKLESPEDKVFYYPFHGYYRNFTENFTINPAAHAFHIRYEVSSEGYPQLHVREHYFSVF